MIDIRERLAEVKNLVTSLDLFEKEGWEISYGISKSNCENRHDDLIARDIYDKTFECGMKYKIVADRLRVMSAKRLTSLPSVDPSPDVDNSYYYKVGGVESLDGKIISRVSENIFSEVPYLDTLHMIVETISTLEAGSKKIYRGKE